jgi:hypothetical protein
VQRYLERKIGEEIKIKEEAQKKLEIQLACNKEHQDYIETLEREKKVLVVRD